ncbi:MAG: hypothetical protein H0W89_04800 [Candidatus Levybacteria bacterium]|nr:hypothetical protein [Candidatus Levybacteria bacterium]
MPLPKSLTTVTTFSKYAALSLFVILPIITFFIGYYYGGLYNSKTVYEGIPIQIVSTPSPTPTFPIVAE